MSMGGGYKPDYTMINAQADVARDMWEHYQNTYVPLENELIEYASDPAKVKTEAAAEAKGDFMSAAALAPERLAREAGRYGGLTATQQKQADKQLTLSSALGTVNASNMATRAVNDRMLEVNQSLVATGQGQADEANTNFGTLASLEASRNSTNAQNAASDYASMMSVAGMGVGLAMSSRKFKENIEPANVEDLVAKLQTVDICKFNYKKEMLLPQDDYYGPIVEDMPDEFTYGDNANMYNLIGALIATVQQQDKRIRELENK